MSKDSPSRLRRRQQRDWSHRGIGSAPEPEAPYTPRSGSDIQRIARQALRACPPDPDGWKAFSIYVQALDLGRDMVRVLDWARSHVGFTGLEEPALGLNEARPHVAVAVKRHGTAGYPCRYCGAPATALDHVWPRSRGGDDHPNNLVPVCKPCNSHKSSSSWLTDRCEGCGEYRDPGDVDTATGQAFYACRCGASWQCYWNLQSITPPWAA